MMATDCKIIAMNADEEDPKRWWKMSLKTSRTIQNTHETHPIDTEGVPCLDLISLMADAADSSEEETKKTGWWKAF